jgi:phosphoribosylaminoimidazole-succinocarboxamide synthase
MSTTYLETRLQNGPAAWRKGKVRDIFDLGDRLLLVATDRLSAFDWVLPTGIPDKGRILTGLSVFWFERLGVAHHLLSTRVSEIPFSLTPLERQALEGRIMIARKALVIPFECVVRGYLAGSGWKEYCASQSVCGVKLPAGLGESAPIDPIFTPAVKAETGHDENVPLAVLEQALGAELAHTLQSRSLDLYRKAASYAAERGLILADTKFEWGFDQETDELLLVDEALTPDSSRYWPASSYRPGGVQASFDKQFVRDWLEQSGWDKSSPPPALPEAIVERTRAKYVEAYERLTGRRYSA